MPHSDDDAPAAKIYKANTPTLAQAAALMNAFTQEYEAGEAAYIPLPNETSTDLVLQQ